MGLERPNSGLGATFLWQKGSYWAYAYAAHNKSAGVRNVFVRDCHFEATHAGVQGQSGRWWRVSPRAVFVFIPLDTRAMP